MEQNGKMVIELTERDVAALKFAMSELQMDEQELVKEFISSITYRAYRSYRGNLNPQNFDRTMINNQEEEDPEKEDKMLQEQVIRWSIRKFGINYRIIRSYLKALESVGEENVTKDEMLKQFLLEAEESDQEIATRRFEINMRMMRSSAQKAYGRIFDYNISTKVVSLNESVKEAILSRKDDFLA